MIAELGVNKAMYRKFDDFSLGEMYEIMDIFKFAKAYATDEDCITSDLNKYYEALELAMSTREEYLSNNKFALFSRQELEDLFSACEHNYYTDAELAERDRLANLIGGLKAEISLRENMNKDEESK